MSLVVAGNKTVKTEAKPLSIFKPKSVARVLSILGGQHARQKMMDLGIIPGAEVEVLQGSSGSPFLLRVGSSRIMLGWGMVQKILVTPATS
jgi:ferrous iron transport protein A